MLGKMHDRYLYIVFLLISNLFLGFYTRVISEEYLFLLRTKIHILSSIKNCFIITYNLVDPFFKLSEMYSELSHSLLFKINLSFFRNEASHFSLYLGKNCLETRLEGLSIILSSSIFDSLQMKFSIFPFCSSCGTFKIAL